MHTLSCYDSELFKRVFIRADGFGRVRRVERNIFDDATVRGADGGDADLNHGVHGDTSLINTLVDDTITAKGVKHMKDFEKFVQSLSDEVLSELEIKAISQANEKFENNKGDLNGIALSIIHERNFNTYMTIALLEKYHQWLAE